MIENTGCADDCTHPDHRHTEPDKTQRRFCAYAACNNPVVRRAGEKLAHFKARLCCSQECKTARDLDLRAERAAGKWAALEAAHDPCVVCDKPFTHRDRETPDRYVDRQTCGAAECIRECIGRKSREQVKHGNTHYNTQRPLVVVEPPAGSLDFGAHNLTFRPDLRRVSKPFVTSYGVASSWAVRG